MAFDMRMQALHRAQQSGNKASNSEQAIRRITSHFADGAWPSCRPPQMKMEMKPMKKLLVSAALTAVLAAPAFAQPYNAGYGKSIFPHSSMVEPRQPARPMPLCPRAPMRAARAIRAPKACRRTIPIRSTTNPENMSAATRIRMYSSSCVATTHMTTKGVASQRNPGLSAGVFS